MKKSIRDQQTARLLETNAMFSSLVCDKAKPVAVATFAFTPVMETLGATLRAHEHLVKQTGGDLVRVKKPEDYGKGLEQIVCRLATRYGLGFDLSENEPDDGKIHRLEVRASMRDKKGKRQKLEVIARRGYYLPKKQAAPKGQSPEPAPNPDQPGPRARQER